MSLINRDSISSASTSLFSRRGLARFRSAIAPSASISSTAISARGSTRGPIRSASSAFIRRADLARDRNDQRPDRFGKGDKVDALVTSVDKASRKVSLSIKAKEVAEEKEAVEQYGSSDSGASLGDILGVALKKKTKKGDE